MQSSGGLASGEQAASHAALTVLSGPAAGAAGAAFVARATDEPDALCARVRAAGAQVTVDLHDTDYGSRDFGILDPEGNRWYFGTYRGAPRAS